MINVIDDALISAIDKINVYLNNKGALRADLLDAAGNYLPSGKGIPLTDLNKILDAIYAKFPVSMQTLFNSHALEVTDANVSREYVVNGNHFTKLKAVTKDVADNLDVATIDSAELFLDDKKNIACSVKTNSGKVLVKDMDAINGILDRLYATGYNSLINLTTAHKLVVSSDVLSEYEFKDNKHLSKLVVLTDIDKITKVEIDLKKDGTIDAKIKYNDNTEKPLTTLDEVNDTIDKLSQAKGKNLTELMSEGIVVCSNNFKKKYVIKDSKSYEAKPKKKAVINLKNVNWKKVGIIGGSVLGVGLATLIAFLIGRGIGGKTTDDNSEKNTGKTDFTVDINLDGETTTFTLTDEDVYRLAQTDYYQEDYTNYRYSSVGSNVEDIDLSTQLDRIDNDALRRESFLFETLVVSEDYDPVKIISDMRNQVMNGTLSSKDFLDSVCPYIYEGINTIKGKTVKSFQDILPFGKYTIYRMTQGVLQEDRKDNYYNSTPVSVNYTFDLLAPTLDNCANDERQVMDSYTRTR